MEFDYFWKKQRALEPEEPKYISLCKILMGSGEDKKVIAEIFDKYMVDGEDYDYVERREMVDYLYEIAKDIDD